MTGTVRGLFVKPTKGAKPLSLESVVTGERGLEGDYHTRFASKRQILLMSSNILEELDLEPGKIFGSGENVVLVPVVLVAPRSSTFIFGAPRS